MIRANYLLMFVVSTQLCLAGQAGFSVKVQPKQIDMFDLVSSGGFIRVDDGDGNINNDIQTLTPKVGDTIRFFVEIINFGNTPSPGYFLELYINDQLYNSQMIETGLEPQATALWYSDPWIVPNVREILYEWRFTAEGEFNEFNNRAIGRLFPQALPTPTPTLALPTPTPTVDPTLPTPTVPPIAGIGDSPYVVYEFSSSESLEDGGWIEIQGGFNNDESQFAEVKIDNLPPQMTASKDGIGVKFTLEPNDISLIFALNTVSTNNRPVLIKAWVWADRPEASIGLVGFKGSLRHATIDGSLALNVTATSIGYTYGNKQIILLYEPEEGNLITPAFQVANASLEETVNIWLDKIEIITLQPDHFYQGTLFDLGVNIRPRQ